MTRAELAALLARKPLRAFTSRTLTDPEAYTETLEEVRRKGYAVDDEEYLEGVRAVAAPVIDRNRLVVAALYAVGFSSRLTPDRMRTLTRLVPAAARRISTQLGAQVYPAWNDHRGEPVALDMEVYR
jgi:IclR family acetate operon transcriptional repressor